MKTVFATATATIMLVVSMVLGLNSTTASAFWMAGSAWATPHFVQGQVCNTNYNTALICDVTAQGVAINLYNGAYQTPIFAYNRVVLYPGQCGLAQVYATGPWAISPWAASAWGICQYWGGTGW